MSRAAFPLVFRDWTIPGPAPTSAEPIAHSVANRDRPSALSQGETSGAILTDADAARILDLSPLVALPGGGSWTAQIISWDSDHAGLIWFRVSVRMRDRVLVCDEAVAEPTSVTGWRRESAGTRGRLHDAVARRVGAGL